MPFEGQGERMRILIVEDHAVIAMMLEDFVRRFGYELVGAVATAEEAIEVARREKPDIVLMDVSLAGRGSGIEAARALCPEHDCDIVFLTAFTAPDTTARMTAIPGATILAKPVGEEKLRASLKRVVERRRSSRPSQAAV